MEDIPRFTTQGRTEPRKYFTAVDEETPSPPPSRPRSRSLPVSGASGALARIARREEESALSELSTALAALELPETLAQHLPVDVVGPILLYWLDYDLASPSGSGTTFPFRASSICHSWREGALATHRLWLYPYFNFRRMLGNTAWIEYHDWVASHAGILTFNITFYNDVISVPPSDPVWASFCNTILVKARRIDLTIDNVDADWDILPSRTFPLLESFSARRGVTDTKCPRVVLNIDAPSFQRLELDKVELEYEEPEDGTVCPIHQITALSLSQSEWGVNQLGAMASTFALLRECTVKFDVLYDCPCDAFSWDSLDSLHITVNVIDGEDIPSKIRLPNLTTLGVNDVKWNWPFWQDFVEMSCPALTRFVVHRNHMDHAADFLAALGTHSRIRTLVFRDGSLNDDLVNGLVRPLRHLPLPFPGLRTVHFVNTTALLNFDFTRIKTVLQQRHDYLLSQRSRDGFHFTCDLKRRPDNDSYDPVGNERRGWAERWVVQYNVEERARFEEIWSMMGPRRT
ncbi:hypothetical protein AURDEDRAFT_123909 [Auricularia subglabra TFB-10046 SS5]|nr:hypothetical protein AURDEDRAFT_123909 [Auricularia subglabra TFB-10046 SS5]